LKEEGERIEYDCMSGAFIVIGLRFQVPTERRRRGKKRAYLLKSGISISISVSIIINIYII
jgi:hypothetical protein